MDNTAADLDALVTSVVTGQQPDATFRALLVLLSAAPDSSMIVSALGKIEPALITDASLRSRAAELLFKAEAPQAALAWAPVSANAPKLSNVVSLRTAEPVTRDAGRADVTFADIGGLEHVKTQIRRKIIAPFTQKAGLFERFKRKAGGGVLMYGPPGCGKTMLARALAAECRATFFNVRPGDILDQYVGNSEKKILQLFDQARS